MLSEVVGCNLIYEHIDGNPIDFFIIQHKIQHKLVKTLINKL